MVPLCKLVPPFCRTARGDIKGPQPLTWLPEKV
uniref:Uncharacterized protein n=1 Tax=Anguilla anguilla TaxID=7936 RepID=A0A0E9TU82_ANGAN